MLPLRKYRTFWFSDDDLRATLAAKDRFVARASDVVVSTACPGADTAWLDALLLSIVPGTARSGGAGSPSARPRFPYLEEAFAGDARPSRAPRIFNTHIPYSLLPDSLKDLGCRIVYVWEDPKANFLSWWRRHCSAGLPFEEAFEMYCSGAFPWGPVWEHVLEYWRDHQRRPERTLFLRQSDVGGEEEEVAGTVLRVAEFMGWKEDLNKGRLPEVVAATVRRRFGCWKEARLEADMVRRMDEITEEKFRANDLHFS